MSMALRVALTDPRLALLAGSRIGVLDEPGQADMLWLLAQIGGMDVTEVDDIRMAWNTGNRARADVGHDLFVSGAAAKGVEPIAADRLWNALEECWSS